MSSRVVYRVTADATFASSAALNNLWSQSIPARLFGTSRLLRVQMFGTYNNNSGGTSTLRFQVIYGATTLWDDTSAANANSAVVRPWMITFSLFNDAATNAQVLHGHVEFQTVAAATTGLGDIGATAGANSLNQNFRGTAAEDSTAAKTLTVKAAHSANNANTTITMEYLIAELIGQ